MRKHTKLFVTVSVLLAVLAVCACAAGFSKTKTYADGTFTDISTQWYAKEVASAYELGFVEGVSENTYSPDTTVTVAQGITMASRVHAEYNGKTIEAVSGGKWYDMYVNYAKENGIITENQFDSYTREIKRFEMAEIFHDAMGENYFNAINDVVFIPDVPMGAMYYDKLLTLYNAGVVMGSDEYGSYKPDDNIKRSECAAIINRVALPENRQVKTLKEYDRKEAKYLIDNFTMVRAVRNRSMIASGWRYENTVNAIVDTEDKSSNSLVDMSNNGHVAMHRDITTVSKGVVELEAMYSCDAPAYSMILTDINGNNMFTLKADKDGNYFAIGDTEQAVDFKHERMNLLTYFVFDLDSRTAKIVIDGKEYRALTLEAMGFEKNAYYYSSNKGAEIYETGTSGTPSQFFATKTFTKDDLPIGAVIWVESGWRYRPEGWTYTGSRPNNVTTTYVTANEAWWGSHTIKGFNISKTNSASLVDVSVETIYENFKIYIPVENIAE